MAKVVACIIARTVSTRLPLKIFRDLTPGVSMIDFLITRIKSVQEIDEIYLCTSTESVDDIMEDVASRNNIKLYRGSADEVIQRMISVGEIESADIVLRITGDNPLSSTEYISHQIQFLLENQLDYVRVVDVPIGATAEVISFNALKECYSKMDKSVSEYLMLFLFEPEQYKCGIIKVFKEDYSNYSVTVDTPEDLARTISLIKVIGKSDITNISLKEIMEVYLNEKIDLPAKIILSNGNVKLPYEKVISFDEFQYDMNRRKKASKTLYLHD